MRIFISSDMEGTAGIAHWDETNIGKPGYEHFAHQMSLEVAAACEGALTAGADDVLVKDAHDSARNIDPALLPRSARIFRSWGSQPYSMMAGIDPSFSGVMFTGYHSAAGTDCNPLAHTMNTQNNFVKINGELCSELRMNCLTAAYEKVPVMMVSGDAGLCAWIEGVCPGVVTVPVSSGIGNGSISIHPALAVDRIRDASERAVCAGGVLFPMPDHFHVEIDFRQHYAARRGGFYPGCTQTGARSVAFDADDYMDVLKFLFWVL